MSIGARTKKQENETIANQVEEYLKQGGEITVVPFGTTGDPMALREMKASTTGHGFIKLGPKHRGETTYERLQRTVAKEICEEYERGRSIRDIARKYSVSESSISKVLRVGGVQVRGRYGKQAENHLWYGAKAKK